MSGCARPHPAATPGPAVLDARRGAGARSPQWQGSRDTPHRHSRVSQREGSFVRLYPHPIHFTVRLGITRKQMVTVPPLLIPQSPCQILFARRGARTQLPRNPTACPGTSGWDI